LRVRSRRISVILDKTITFNQWLSSLKDGRAKVIIARRLEKIENENHLGDCESVGAGVYELRIHYGAGYRIYFSYDGKDLILLLCGGDKSTQQKDIKKAKEMQW
jgi:putative addiction module killer protein